MDKYIIRTFIVFFVLACITVTVYAAKGTGKPSGGMFAKNTNTRISPVEAVGNDDGSYTVIINARDIIRNGGCLSFTTSFSDVHVYADSVQIYESIGPGSRLMRSNANVCHFINVPKDSIGISVNIRYVYTDMSTTVPEFSMGDFYNVRSDIVVGSTPALIISLLDIICGLAIIIYFHVVGRFHPNSSKIVAFGIAAVLLGIWSAGETNAMVVLMENRSLAAVCAFLLLIFIPSPYIIYIHSVLWKKDRFFFRIPICCCLFDFVLVMVLAFTGIMDLKESVVFTHLTWGVALLYATAASVITVVSKSKSVAMAKAGRQNGSDAPAPDAPDKLALFNAAAMFFLIASSVFEIAYYWTGSRAQNDVTGRILILGYFILLGYLNIRESFKSIEKGKMAEYYEKLANTDALTGLANRTAFSNALSGLTADTEYTIISIDLNDLKLVNDKKGHQAGDRYIVNSANLLNKVFGGTGTCYRAGGDEFFVVIKASGSDALTEGLIEKMKAEIDLQNRKHPSDPVSFAFGYETNTPDAGRDFNEVLRCADAKMYEHKRLVKGREPRS